METSTSTPTRDTAPPVVPLLSTPLPMWLVGILMAVAFGAGYLLQVAIPETDVSPTPTSTVEAPPLPLDFAPPLTDDQLDVELPEGHPPIGDTGNDGVEGEVDGSP